jgi:uncharacterized protein YcsI (UPF0317 family)
VEFKNLSAALVLAGSQQKIDFIQTNVNKNSGCIVISESANNKSLACNFQSHQIDDKTKVFLQNYMKENQIKEIFSVEATWTEGIQ